MTSQSNKGEHHGTVMVGGLLALSVCLQCIWTVKFLKNISLYVATEPISNVMAWIQLAIIFPQTLLNSWPRVWGSFVLEWFTQPSSCHLTSAEHGQDKQRLLCLCVCHLPPAHGLFSSEKKEGAESREGKSKYFQKYKAE